MPDSISSEALPHDRRQSAPRVVVGAEGLRALVGVEVGCSDWLTLTQERIDSFADATGDHQWIHVDVERARTGPYGGTIAHGYLTLSLLPELTPQILRVDGFRMGLNYGCDRIRFPAPVPAGSRVRARLRIDDVTDVPGGVQVTSTATVEIEGSNKPACVATLLGRRYT
jgi:acyl dehydratase